MSTKKRKSSTSGKAPAPASKPSTKTSRKPITSTSSTTTSKEIPETGLVRIHDLTSQVVVYLPPAVLDILGEEAYQRLVAGIGQHVLTLIVREPEVVIYLDMAMFVLDAKRTSTFIKQPVTPSDPQKAPTTTKPPRKKLGPD